MLRRQVATLTRSARTQFNSFGSPYLLEPPETRLFTNTMVPGY